MEPDPEEKRMKMGAGKVESDGEMKHQKVVFMSGTCACIVRIAEDGGVHVDADD